MVERELTAKDFARGSPRSVRKRLMEGNIRGGSDVTALRDFVGLTQERFAAALGISIHTLRNWEQGRRKPVGPAMALLKVASENPEAVREALGA